METSLAAHTRGYRSNRFLDQVRPHVHMKQKWFLSIEHLECMYGGAAGGGKSDALIMAAMQYALDVDTLLPNPYGWIRVKDVRPGDTVYAPDGSAVQVTHVTETYRKATCYELKFNDGSTLVADKDHKWAAHSFADRLRAAKKPTPLQIVSTEHIFHTFRTEHKKPTSNWSVEVPQPVQFPEANLPVDPYVLGAWLGDGASRDGTMAGIDPEIRQEFENAGYETVTYGKHQWHVGRLRTDLGMLGVLGDKHVPLIYLRASIEQRLALLQGFMDTDGTVDKKYGGCRFFNTNPKLAEAVVELVRSLGWVAFKSSQRYVTQLNRKVKEGELVSFNADRPVFRLPRKIRLQKMYRKPYKFITNVTKVKSRPVKCLTVDHSSHLFIAGEAYTPTHNCDIPGYAAILLRKTYADLSLPGALLDRANLWLSKTEAIKRDGGIRWDFPGGGTIQFGYLDNPKDRFRYMSAEFQFVAFDEVSQIPEESYSYMFSRLRRPSNICRNCDGRGWTYRRRATCKECSGTGQNLLASVPLRMRSATNPGGEYGEWVKHAFITKKYLEADEEFQFSRVWAKEGDCTICNGVGKIEVDAEMIDCYICGTRGKVRRYFVPARLKDNPSVDQIAYKQSLSKLSDQERAQLEHGRWDLVTEGTLFKSSWLRSYRWRGEHLETVTNSGSHLFDSTCLWFFTTADTASSAKTTADYTVICTWAVLPNWSICLVDVIRKRMEIPYIVPEIAGAMNKWWSRFLIIEEASSGIGIIQQARHDNEHSQFVQENGKTRISLDYGKLIPFKPHGSDKVHRAQDALSRMRAENIFFPEKRTDTIVDCINEMLLFDGVGGSANDDFVDNLSMAGSYIANQCRATKHYSAEPAVQVRGGLMAPQKYRQY